MLVDFQADVPPDDSARYELRPEIDTPAIDGRLSVEPTSDALIVDTGMARFRVPQAGCVLFASVANDGAMRTAVAVMSIWITDTKDRRRAVELSHPRVELSGPLRVVIRIDGRALVGRAALAVTARLHFFAGLSAVRVELSVTNPRPARHRRGHWDLGDPGSVHFRDLSVICAPAAPIVGVSCSSELDRALAAYPMPMEIYQDSSGGDNWRSSNHINGLGNLPLSFQGYRLVSAGKETHGARATPIVHAETVNGEIVVCVPQFWQNFPKAIEVDRDVIAVRVLPRQFADGHELQGGERKTHTFVLGFGADPVTAELPLAWARSPLIAAATPNTYAAGGVWRPLSVGTEASHRTYRRLVDAAIDGPSSFEAKREQIDEYGWRHFGDIYADHEAVNRPGLVSHYNNQYDPIRGFATRFCETGDHRWWFAMHELASHVADVDIYHCDRDRSVYNGGMFWHTSHYADAHTATHRSYPRASGHGGGPSNEHNYTSGLLLHYFLTGCDRSREAVIELAEWVLRMDDGSKSPFWWIDRRETGLATATRDPDFHGPGRGAAYSINALIDAHQLTGESKYLAKTTRLIRRCIHPSDDPEQLGLRDAERRWSYTVFLQVLGKYLEYRHDRVNHDPQVDYVRTALVNYATWMMVHDGPYLERASQLEYPTETWVAQDIRKAAVLEFAAQYAPSRELRDSFLARAGALFDYSVETLDQMPTRGLTRPIVLMLAYGFQRPMTEFYEPVGVVPPDRFGPSMTNRFVPYKRRVIKRLGAMLMAAAVVVLAIVGMVIIYR